MHIFYAHVPALLRTYQNLARFSQQPIEKFNDVAKVIRMRATNRKKTTYRQMLHHLILLFVLDKPALGTTKHQVHFCSVCQKPGHKKNSNNCPSSVQIVQIE